MTPLRILWLAVAAALAVAGPASRARAVQLAIANSSFEAPVFADGGFAFLVNVPAQGSHGWTFSDGSFIYNPQAGDYTGAGGNGTPQGTLGPQVAGVFGFGDYALSQQLAGVDAMVGNGDDPLVDVGTVYTITFSVGLRPSVILSATPGAATMSSSLPAPVRTPFSSATNPMW